MKNTDPQFGTEANAIQAVIADYFGGIFHGDVERLRRAFHPSASLHGDVNGQPYFRPLEDYLEAVRNRKSPHDLGETFRMCIISLECLNGIAVVRLHCPMLGMNYYDYLALNKIEGQWLIVNKLFTHVGTA